MDKTLITANCFGTLSCDLQFMDNVSISYDTLSYDHSAEYKILVQIEPPEILNLTESIIKNSGNFDLILAWDKNILSKCGNSKKFIFGSSWINQDKFVANKSNQISFLTSNKLFGNVVGHKLRHEVFNKLSNQYNDFTVLKLMTPPRIEDKSIMFTEAKYSIIVENVSSQNWVTEKLIDCLVTKTIPLYWGCPNVGDYFNESGILTFTSFEELLILLNSLTIGHYESLVDVVNENYLKSLEYVDFHSRVGDVILDKFYNK
tara:strand:+ start:302 stop:1081 length:780 start_codon:yes stop_codon:yes gene_type:complete